MPRFTRQNLLAALLGVVTATICVRLGIWQLHRLAQRRARNAVVAARLAAPPLALADIPAGDSAATHYRRVHLDGRWDFDHELVVTARSREGAPGVHLVTPLVVRGAPMAILVDRGWAFSPDA